MKSNFTKTSFSTFLALLIIMLFTSRLFASQSTLSPILTTKSNIHSYTNGWLTTCPTIALGVNIVSISNVTCNGDQNGSITALAVDGVPPYTYLWSNGATTAMISGLAPGTYTVTATDAAFATAVSVPVTITEPWELEISELLGNFNIDCNNPDGLIILYVGGGNFPYTYQWSNGATGQEIENLDPGIYTVTVTDVNGCTLVISQEITEFIPDEITLLRLDNVTCHGLTDGLLEVTVLNPVHINTYSWSNGSTGSIIGNLAAGNYTVTMTSSTSVCTTVETYTITQPQPLYLEGGFLQNLTCHNSTDAILRFGSEGGSGGNTFQWSTGETTEQIMNVGPGIYGFTITDSNGCTTSSSLNVIVPDSLVIDLVRYSIVGCSGEVPGLLNIQAQGGYPSYQYLWSNGATSNLIVGNIAGAYQVTVTDELGCTATNEFILEQDTALVIGSPIVTDIACGGDSIGSILLPSVSGVTYRWGDGREGSLLDSLPAGDYVVVATDANNCVSDSLVININENPKIKSSLITADTLLCAGEVNGFLETSLTGGIGKLDFRWNTGDTTNLKLENLIPSIYSLAVVDSLGCRDTFEYPVVAVPSINLDSVLVSQPRCYDSADGSIALLVSGGYKSLTYLWADTSTDSVLVDIKAGDYQVTVTDENSCMLIQSLTLVAPDSIVIAATAINETLAGNMDGRIEIIASGGTAPYTIAWMNGATSFVLDGLATGSYEYTIADANGCNTSGNVIIGVGECALSFIATAINPTCHDGNNGEITLDLPGNPESYTITLRKDGAVSLLPLNQLGTGTYEVTVTDSLGCTFEQNDIVLISANPAIVLDEVKIVKPTSTTNSDGSLEVSITGGLAPLSYRWSLGGNLISTTQKVENLKIGVYTVEVIDGAGCTLVVKDIKLESVSAVFDLATAKIELFPNPTSNELNINAFDAAIIKSIQLHHINGTALSENIIVNDSSIILDLDAFGINQNGVYLVKISLAETILIKKVILLK